jgi:hypothetical protein
VKRGCNLVSALRTLRTPSALSSLISVLSAGKVAVLSELSVLSAGKVAVLSEFSVLSAGKEGSPIGR